MDEQATREPSQHPIPVSTSTDAKPDDTDPPEHEGALDPWQESVMRSLSVIKADQKTSKIAIGIVAKNERATAHAVELLSTKVDKLIATVRGHQTTIRRLGALVTVENFVRLLAIGLATKAVPALLESLLRHLP